MKTRGITFGLNMETLVLNLRGPSMINDEVRRPTMKTQEEHIAAAAAHRACCGVEHSPEQGKLHGYCIVCGVPWPCATAKRYLIKEAHDEV